ncbi:hypothetical protein ACWCQ0_44005, partial [Streptomyces massasporeus]
NVEPQESGAASGLLNAMQQVGGSLGLSILVTVFGTASRNEADTQVPAFLSQATPLQKAEFARTGQLPAPWGDQVLTSGVSAVTKPAETQGRPRARRSCRAVGPPRPPRATPRAPRGHPPGARSRG